MIILIGYWNRRHCTDNDYTDKNYDDGNDFLASENSAYQHCLKEGGKVVSKVFTHWRRKMEILIQYTFVNCAYYTWLPFFSKVFCLPHYYRKDVIPPTGISTYPHFLFTVWKNRFLGMSTFPKNNSDSNLTWYQGFNFQKNKMKCSQIILGFQFS